MRKAVIITGVGKGFGRALAKSLIESYHVVGLTRSRSDLQDLRAELELTSHSFELIEADVSDFTGTEERVTTCLDATEYPLFGLINNAGIFCRRSIFELSMKDIMDVSAINLFGAVNMTKISLPYLLDSGGGKIINVSSIISAQSPADLSAYAISKGGMDAFTRSMANELGDKNIAVNSVLPGFSKTSYFERFSQNRDRFDKTLDRIPMGRWGEPDEIVGICKFLLSNESSYITGASIPVDGGYMA